MGKDKWSEGTRWKRERERDLVCERDNLEKEREGERRGTHLLLVQRFTAAERLQRAGRRWIRGDTPAWMSCVVYLGFPSLHSHQSRGNTSANSCMSAGRRRPPQGGICTAVCLRYSCSSAWQLQLQLVLRKTRWRTKSWLTHDLWHLAPGAGRAGGMLFSRGEGSENRWLESKRMWWAVNYMTGGEANTVSRSPLWEQANGWRRKWWTVDRNWGQDLVTEVEPLAFVLDWRSSRYTCGLL